ncbi:MAG: AmpG family muropeptide MFS transporter [Cellvibrionales bacterium TMED49]|nr:AmpG family muropeptide MFS transporter [Porticoccaceae bacterium]OUU38870.1 MAG: AmpG family muropeptide MFS transporter [Cellvibrionales bacterium TMED49]
MWTIWQSLFNRRMLICIFTGFSSGMPLYLLITLIPAWLRSEGVGLEEIGLFALIGLPYTWKFIWAPALDRYSLSFLGFNLGIRRSWMLLTQLTLFICIFILGSMNPKLHLWSIAYLCTFIAFLSATQDISIDAYRRQILPDHELGLGNSIHVNAYRISGLIPGSLALILSDFLPWSTVFFITGAFMLISVGFSLIISEPKVTEKQPENLRRAITEPFQDFFNRHPLRTAVLILAFMLFYKLGDSMATALATPFYIDLGFTNTEIGLVAKHAALWPMIFGGIAGGIIMIKIGINRALWLFGFIQIISILGFAVLARIGEGLWLLGLVISFEYLGVGLGTSAFVAFIARTANPAFAATQLALFTALTALPRTLFNSTAGIIVDIVGWEYFFYLCTLLAIPGMLLLVIVAPWHRNQSHHNDQ